MNSFKSSIFIIIVTSTMTWAAENNFDTMQDTWNETDQKTNFIQTISSFKNSLNLYLYGKEDERPNLQEEHILQLFDIYCDLNTCNVILNNSHASQQKISNFAQEIIGALFDYKDNYEKDQTGRRLIQSQEFKNVENVCIQIIYENNADLS